jgi:hypothetical protein
MSARPEDNALMNALIEVWANPGPTSDADVFRDDIRAAGYITLSEAAYDRRITELLEANNREVELRRAAEGVGAEWMRLARELNKRNAELEGKLALMELNKNQ